MGLWANFIMLLAAAIPLPAWGQGGPPLVTDDPGTPRQGHWEINVPALLASANHRDLLQFPYLDLNYGLKDRTQLKLETGWVLERTHYSTLKGGAGTLLVGVKQRFLDEPAAPVALSIFPQFQFHHFFSSRDPALVEPGNEYLLPVEASKKLGKWGFSADLGYTHPTTAPETLFYGLAAGYENAAPWEPLAEIHVDMLLDGSGNAVLLDAGIRYSLNPHVNLLFAAGHTVTHPLGVSTELDVYLGVQVEL